MREASSVPLSWGTSDTNPSTSGMWCPNLPGWHDSYSTDHKSTWNLRFCAILLTSHLCKAPQWENMGVFPKKFKSKLVSRYLWNRYSYIVACLKLCAFSLHYVKSFLIWREWKVCDTWHLAHNSSDRQPQTTVSHCWMCWLGSLELTNPDTIQCSHN